MPMRPRLRSFRSTSPADLAAAGATAEKLTTARDAGRAFHVGGGHRAPALDPAYAPLLAGLGGDSAAFRAAAALADAWLRGWDAALLETLVPTTP